MGFSTILAKSFFLALMTFQCAHASHKTLCVLSRTYSEIARQAEEHGGIVPSVLHANHLQYGLPRTWHEALGSDSNAPPAGIIPRNLLNLIEVFDWLVQPQQGLPRVLAVTARQRVGKSALIREATLHLGRLDSPWLHVPIEGTSDTEIQSQLAFSLLAHAADSLHRAFPDFYANSNAAFEQLADRLPEFLDSEDEPTEQVDADQVKALLAVLDAELGNRGTNIIFSLDELHIDDEVRNRFIHTIANTSLINIRFILVFPQNVSQSPEIAIRTQRWMRQRAGERVRFFDIVPDSLESFMAFFRAPGTTASPLGVLHADRDAIELLHHVSRGFTGVAIMVIRSIPVAARPPLQHITRAAVLEALGIIVAPGSLNSTRLYIDLNLEGVTGLTAHP